jgi:hypothetical protein
MAEPEELQATASVYFDVYIDGQGAIEVSHHFAGDPDPCEIRLYDEDDVDHDNHPRQWEIRQAIIEWINGQTERLSSQEREIHRLRNDLDVALDKLSHYENADCDCQDISAGPCEREHIERKPRS